MNQFKATVKQGSSDTESISLIKQRLNQLGYGPLDATNSNFGLTTLDVVKHFQELNQLNDDGEVGELTWARIFSHRANKPVSSTILRFRALEIMNTQIGVREKTGHNDGTEVKSYLASVGLPEGYAWCQSLVYWSFDKAAKQLGIPNPMPKTGGVVDHLEHAKKAGATILTSNPAEGDIFIMIFGEGKGHTGMVDSNEGSLVFTIEGNTNDGGSREGDGVYERSRPITGIKYFIRYEQKQ